MPRSKAETAALMASPDDIEAQFYEALREADLERLMALWADDEEIFCVHPGGPRVVGADAIRATFEAIFANGAIAVHADKVRRVHAAGGAVHSVVERIEVPGPEGAQTAWVLATNVYVHSAQGWRLVAHHASPGSPREPPEIAETPSILH
ncbi:MAG: YybH family protein [Gammaproteobacteria bacterium]|uniref:YybH family protein n=1 Tax=Azohydromonas sp. TaxID=1872666 RepID=UPI002BB30064|nr:nuclear transport factor 2 family protein [Azohydromonas sp.]HMM84690.1 nuclear transport factor 2 family protein [Azohydromonas sp.]